MKALLFASTLTGGLGHGAMASQDDARPAIVYKILTRPEMQALQATGRFDGSEQDAADGFIHLSTESQLTRTADLHFAGKNDLFIASVDTKAAGAQIRWEVSPRSGLTFPHLYGVLDKGLVTRIVALRRDGEGRVVLDGPSAPSDGAPAAPLD